MKKGPDMPGWFSRPTTISGPMQWGPNGTAIAQDWQQRQIGKKAPAGTSLLGAKVAIRYTRPKEH